MDESVLRIIEHVSLFLAAIFAIYGLFTNFKNQDGSMTKHGLIACLLVILSFAVTMVAKEVAYNINRNKSKLELEKYFGLLENINRSLYPIGDSSVDFRIYFKIDESHKKEYYALLADNKLFLPSGEVNTDVFGALNIYTFQNNSKGPWLIDLPFGTPIFPKGVFNRVVRDSFFTIEVYKKDVIVSSLMNSPIHRPTPELAIEVQTEISGNRVPIKYQNHNLNLDIQNFGFDIEMRDYFIESNHWYKSGNMTSGLDLLGAIIAVRISKKFASADKESDALLDKIKSDQVLKWITIDIRGFPRICLNGEMFGRYKDSDGYPVFITSLPQDIGAISNLNPNETIEYQSKPSGAPKNVLLGWFRL